MKIRDKFFITGLVMATAIGVAFAIKMKENQNSINTFTSTNIEYSTSISVEQNFTTDWITTDDGSYRFVDTHTIEKRKSFDITNALGYHIDISFLVDIYSGEVLSEYSVPDDFYLVLSPCYQKFTTEDAVMDTLKRIYQQYSNGVNNTIYSVYYTGDYIHFNLSYNVLPDINSVSSDYLHNILGCYSDGTFYFYNYGQATFSMKNVSMDFDCLFLA